MELDFSDDIIEKLLLKKALLDKNWLNILSNVYDSRWFKVPNLGLVLKLVLGFYKKYSSIPSNPAIQALAKRYIETRGDSDVKMSDVSQLLAEAMNIDLRIDDAVIQSNLKEFIRRNAFYNSLFDNAELLEKSPENYSKVVEKCLENFDRVQKITFNDTDIGIDYFDKSSADSHWDYIRNPSAKIKTGWESMDEYTNGGFLKDGKMLALFMAQAGLGKSVFLSNLAVNLLKQNLNVVVISLEMSEDVYACRFDAHISQSNINKLKDCEETARQRLAKFHEDYPGANLYIKEYPPRSITSNDIQTYVENLKNAGHQVDAIIVDYLNLVLPIRRTDSMFKDGMAVSEELRRLSYIFNVPVISAVQCNTEGMQSSEIDMQNVSESRGIVHTVDALFALYQLDEDRENGIINMKVVKNRLGGMVGKHAQFAMNPESLSLTDVTFGNSYKIGVEDESEASKLESSLSSIQSDLQDIQDL